MSGKILIANKNRTALDKLEKLLQEHNYQVVAVNSGELVAEKLSSFVPQMVILDTILSDANGYEVCEYIKAQATFSQVPVILLFSVGESINLVEARRVGANRCLPESISGEQLITIINFIWSGIKPLADNATQKGSTNRGSGSPLEPEHEAALDFEPIDSNEDDNTEAEVYTFEVDLEDISEEPEVTEEIEDTEYLPLQMRAENNQVEIPGLETTTKKTPNLFALFSTKDSTKEASLDSNITPINSSITSFDNADSPISEDHFRFTPSLESIDDPLQIKDELNTVNCSECGAKILSNDIFCIDCGSAVDSSTFDTYEGQNCSQCNNAINNGDIFCLNCGAVL